jgi:hypothetical protein
MLFGAKADWPIMTRIAMNTKAIIAGVVDKIMHTFNLKHHFLERERLYMDDARQVN